MARALNIKESKDYCDKLFTELDDIKNRLYDLKMFAEKSTEEHVNVHATLINDIIKTVDWKMEILLRECPVEWKATEATPSVQETKEQFSAGGYVGG